MHWAPSLILNYRGVQQAILRRAGQVFAYAPAERAGGRAAWTAHVSEIMAPEEIVPTERPAVSPFRKSTPLYPYEIPQWRRENQEPLEVSA
jgi:hypothetical protein